MTKAHYVRVGRLVRIMRGPRQDRVGVISAIVDSNRVLVENPADSKMWRHVQNLKNVQPLRFAITIPINAKTNVIKKAMEDKKVLEKWTNTRKAKTLASKAALANANDFERYQLRVAKRSLASWTRKQFAENDAKTPVSHKAKLLAKLQRTHKKFESKNWTARHERIKKAMTARKAKKAKKGKKESKK